MAYCLLLSIKLAKEYDAADWTDLLALIMGRGTKILVKYVFGKIFHSAPNSGSQLRAIPFEILRGGLATKNYKKYDWGSVDKIKCMGGVRE